jgi:hypothetical protein
LGYSSLATQLVQALEAKGHGEKLAVVPHRVLALSVNLMTALKKRVEA